MLKEKIDTKKLTTIALLTALYCALSATMKIPFIGAISLDLGYIALAIACGTVGPWAGFVGAVGCGFESILFSPYGFSISWFVANLIIGCGCGAVFYLTEDTKKRVLSVLMYVGIGMLIFKTGIECFLYHIPFAVKIVKNAVAFGVDSVVMIAGIGILKKIKPAIDKI